MRELFANTTLYETLKKFDDIPFIIYHDYAKDNFFELKNAHPILLDSNLSKNWYQHYKNLQQNFFFTENDIILFRGYYNLIYSTFPIQHANSNVLSGAFVFGGFRSKTSLDKIRNLHTFPILDDQIIQKKCNECPLSDTQSVQKWTLRFKVSLIFRQLRVWHGFGSEIVK